MIEGLSGSLGLGIVLGLFLGKPIGVFLMSWLAVRSGLSELPERTNWVHVLGLSLLGGVGFTMSIFIALLSFGDISHQTEAKFAVLIASLLAGIAGSMLLHLHNRRSR